MPPRGAATRKSETSGNLVHAIIKSALATDTIIRLIGKSNQAALSGGGRRLEIVRALVRQADKALDITTRHESLSVFAYHNHTLKLCQEEYDRVNENRRVDTQTVKSGARGALDRKLKDKPGREAKGNPETDEFNAINVDGFKPQRLSNGINVRRWELHAPAELVEPVKPLVRRDSHSPHTPVQPSLRVVNEGFQSISMVGEKDLQDPREWEGTANEVREFLKLHYLRTRDPEKAESWLYGTSFDYSEVDPSNPEIHAQDFIHTFEHFNLDKVLQFVRFRNVRVRGKEAVRFGDGVALSSPTEDDPGRTDMLFFFHWLRHKKKVERIVKVIVDDCRNDPHSDQTIEACLQPFMGEVLGWRKTDLCPLTISEVGKELREVSLLWSGSNSVLRGWSEAEGLVRCPALRKINLNFDKMLDSREGGRRVAANINRFKERLSKNRTDPASAITVDDDHDPDDALAMTLSNALLGGIQGEGAEGKQVNTHKWLDSIDRFVNKMQNVDCSYESTLFKGRSISPDLFRNIVVAVIDDGVDIWRKAIRTQIQGGTSFDTGSRGHYRFSSNGHGTVMACMVARVCPMAKIHVIKVQTFVEPGKADLQIDVDSAIKAIDAAVDRNVDIISMSWSIKKLDEGSPKKQLFEGALQRARDKIFRIGAATSTGRGKDSTPDSQTLEYLLPGHEVLEKRPKGVQKLQSYSGSSVATARAAGLGALVIHIIRLGALHHRLTAGGGISGTQAVVSAKDFSDTRSQMAVDHMRMAFKHLGLNEKSRFQERATRGSDDLQLDEREDLESCTSASESSPDPNPTADMSTPTETSVPECGGEQYLHPGSEDIMLIVYTSGALGIVSFFSFCFWRPRWKSLYAARKARLDADVNLPSLPDSFFGWIPSLYRATEEQVLASAGLDAFVFLNFFKMAIRIFSIMIFFAAAVLTPINAHFLGRMEFSNPRTNSYFYSQSTLDQEPWGVHGKPDKEKNITYLWAYLVFTYFFSILVLYILNRETVRVLRVRQDYLGTQSTITDRTFRLSGIPRSLRSEEKLKTLFEKLEIGQVEKVVLCRDWRTIDGLIERRETCLRQLEDAWSDYNTRLQATQAGLSGRLDGSGERRNNDESGTSAADQGNVLQGMAESGLSLEEGERPKVRLWYGFLRLRSRKTDAIDYYEEKLRRLDAKIQDARGQSYDPADLAFVTMDSIASCQMAIQALIDPRPGRLLTKPAPSPTDVVWRNTYAPRGVRRMKSWIVTIFITVLTLVWLLIVASLASLLSICTIRKALPGFAKYLADHDWIRLLVQSGLPTGAVSLLNVMVPFLYDYLSHHQGMISRGQIELSVISKNFFFTFFNIFLVFTISGSTTQFLPALWGALDKTHELPQLIARSIMKTSDFYISFIVLQGVGLMPFRLLEPGGIAQHAWGRLTAKTPRDFSEMKAPPLFSYGYYLPTAILIFVLCLVYSILQKGVLMLLAGLIYFVLSYFTYKYQLLYAMDQPQHATGQAWPMISYRIVLGLFFFQLTMAGVLGLQEAFKAAGLVAPLVVFTVWYGYYFRRRYEPLTMFISLRSIRADTDPEEAAGFSDGMPTGRPALGTLRRGSTLDEEREKGLRYVNPSLKLPLVQPWIYKDPPPLIDEDSTTQSPLEAVPPEVQSSSSSLSLGDTHIWRSEGNV
ncbi:uncharacterized protein DNG_00193 [Cephalotrichum gorgonifer]|uniref:Peptidase S8/S53 domain-containing protein n=1 Tax=Cephalotrichum gorgonifer TaxID=2041049 RepID=A0AAE8MPJ4_9PEZI|nr:uncharacterized protein DNG_00193 [Cephalotrichum gorgonifer]